MVSIIIPCWNEQHHIASTLRSIFNQDYPAQLIEIIIVDGGSTDNTLNIIHSIQRSRTDTRIRIVDNPYRTTAYALNIGIAVARGEIIFTFGAHTRYSPNYISGAIKILNQSGADAVGSIAVTLPSAPTAVARTIARILSSPFGVGNSLMRIRGRKKSSGPINTPAPVTADTASCPGYRRTVFDKIGKFNTALVRNQDIEFHLRLRRAGGKVLLSPEIKTYYYARATFAQLFKNNLENGYWVIKSIRYAALPFAPRHLVPAIFVSTFLLTALTAPFLSLARILFVLTIGLYLLADISASLLSFVTSPSTLIYFPLYLITYPILHTSYGLGSLWALLTLWRPDPAPRLPGNKAQQNADPIHELPLPHVPAPDNSKITATSDPC